jgi:DinB superfamily
MNATALLATQWNAVNAGLHSLAQDLRPDEWTFRVAPGQNLLGFMLWHIPACQDWTVQTWVRNLPEVRDRDTWRRWASFERLGMAFGISLDEADAVARAVTVDEMLAYADAVVAENLSWLRSVTEADLGRVPDNRAHLARHPTYRTAQYQAEVRSMWTQTLGEVVALDAGHGRAHLGEAALVKELARQRPGGSTRP